MGTVVKLVTLNEVLSEMKRLREDNAALLSRGNALVEEIGALRDQLISGARTNLELERKLERAEAELRDLERGLR
jgi:septal ring factor EnvC (AmiA/AmiB activator)